MGLLDFFKRRKGVNGEGVENGGRDLNIKPQEMQAAKRELPEWLEFSADMDYEGSGIRINVSLRNKGAELIGNPVMKLSVSSRLFRVEGDRIEVQSLDPGREMKGSFVLVPLAKMKVYTPKIDIEYFDFTLKERVGFTLDLEDIVFESDMTLRPYTMGDDEFRVFTGSLSALEFESDEMNAEPDSLFEGLSDTLREMGMYRVEPVMKAPEVYRALGRFACTDDIGDIYCIELQVIGRNNISRFLLRFWSKTGRRVAALRGMAVDTITKRYPVEGTM